MNFNIMMKLSIIFPILESYEAVQRQVIHMSRILAGRGEIQLIFVDDGSVPPLQEKVNFSPIRDVLGDRFIVHQTYDYRPWTEGCARNAGAKISIGKYLLMQDIDHILTDEAIDAVMSFSGDKMHFQRKRAVLTEDGELRTDPEIIFEYGGTERDLTICDSSHNAFAMRREIFLDMLHGYDPKFCGSYGGEDVDINNRYGELFRKGLVERSVRGPVIYVFPDPRRDVKKLFHSLR